MMVREGRAQVRQTAKKQPKVFKSYSFPAPSLGWVANNNLSVSQPGGAAVLENFFPTATGAKMRRGKKAYATLGDGTKPVSSLFSYVVGTVQRMFAATEAAVYDITSISSAYNYALVTEDDEALETEDGDTFGSNSTEGLDVLSGMTGGNWSVVQFATSGGVYLIGVNGEDDGFVYDGTTFYPSVEGGIWGLDYDAETAAFTEGETLTGGTSGATATIVKVIDNGTDGTLWLKSITGTFEDDETITDGSSGSATANGVAVSLAPGIGGDIDTSSLVFVWVYKNRLWFIGKDSMNAWYLDVGAVGGDLTKLSMGGEFQKGGSLLFGGVWSQDVGNGLNEMCVFASTEGEAVVYQGDDPSTASTWGRVGTYQTGKAMGPNAHLRIGGDLIIATDVGFVPLSEALRRDFTMLAGTSLSAPIEAEWPAEVAARNSAPWTCELWSARQMVIVTLPTVNEQLPRMLVMNARTGKWAPFTNWGANCALVFQDRLFIGDDSGMVFECDVTGLDEGEPYTATYLPVFDQLGVPGIKTVSMVRAVTKSTAKPKERMSVHADYRVDFPSPPDAPSIPADNVWGSGVWGGFTWGEDNPRSVFQEWKGQFGMGEVVSVGHQFTSGSVVPLDVELVRTDVLFTVGEVIA